MAFYPFNQFRPFLPLGNIKMDSQQLAHFLQIIGCNPLRNIMFVKEFDRRPSGIKGHPDGRMGFEPGLFRFRQIEAGIAFLKPFQVNRPLFINGK